MPQASEQLRGLIRQRFDGSIDSSGPIEELKNHGYTLNKDFTWSHPDFKTLGAMPREDFDCMLFLIHEWDFGALNEQE